MRREVAPRVVRAAHERLFLMEVTAFNQGREGHTLLRSRAADVDCLLLISPAIEMH